MGSAGAEGQDASVFIDLGDDVSDDMAQLWQEIASASAEAPLPSITSSPPTSHLGQVRPPRAFTALADAVGASWASACASCSRAGLRNTVYLHLSDGCVSTMDARAVVVVGGGVAVLCRGGCCRGTR